MKWVTWSLNFILMYILVESNERKTQPTKNTDDKRAKQMHTFGYRNIAQCEFLFTPKP